MTEMNANQEKFQALLRELFQFDCADLDFGIYRIMNYKRDVIEKFITKDLPKAVSDELNRGVLADQSSAAKELREIAGQISKMLGKDALDADGNLADKFHDTEIGRRYLDLRPKAAGGRGREALEANIFNHLFAFFSRYYQDGDFISKRRYSKRQKYAVPYNGEEVHLYWANSDQYYIKTAEHFNRYTFTSKDVTVQFEIQAADVEQNNVKGEKRFFLPRCKDIVWDEKAGLLIIPFEFRPLTEQEEITYGKKNQQEAISIKALEDIPKQLKKADNALLALTAERRKDADGKSVTFLEHHLRQYTRSNTSDFFIHKDLKGFLSRELDFYLKNEVLNLDEMEAAGVGRSEGWFQVMRVIKATGGHIIDFLSQIENFQKMLWEKKKFITETQYCVTAGNIKEGFYPEIADCEVQWAEWKELFHIDEEQTDLFTTGKSRKDKRVAFLKAHPTLVLDTKHFEQGFVDRLLAGFDDLDGMTDGLLVHSENFQALNFLVEKYREKVKCIYIDPPYNTGGSSFIYKNGYRHSSWMSMMAAPVRRSCELLTKDGVNVTAIDDYEVGELLLLLDSLFGEEQRLGILSIENKPSGRTNDMFLATSHEYYLFHGLKPENVSINFFPLSEEARSRYRDTDEISAHKWRDFLRTGGYSTPEERPNSYYPIYLDQKTGKLSLEKQRGLVEILPIDSSGQKRVWWKTKPSFLEHIEIGEIRARQKQDGGYKIEIIDRIKEGTRPKSIWVGARYDASSHGTKLLKDILGEARQFDFPKSLYAVRDAVYCITNPDGGDIICDYFAGSGTTGHATISLNREDEGNRKFILVEMGDYFDTVLLPRIKKVTFSPEWKDGKPKRMATKEEAERSPRIVKYIRLESYEDALNNIQFDDASGQAGLRFDDYLLKYMLHWEARKSETLLNVEKLASPFSYTLHIRRDGQTTKKVVDIPETFNYLLGLNVSRRQVEHDKDRRYLVYRGRIDHRVIAVIWRETDGWTKADLERDKNFVAAQKFTEGADEVFVNGDSFIPGAKSLEPVFKARMFTEAQA